MSHSPLECLRHIVDETEYLLSQTQGLAQEQFLRDPTLKRAFVRSIDYQIVWDVAAHKAPALHRAIQRILDEEGQRP